MTTDKNMTMNADLRRFASLTALALFAIMIMAYFGYQVGSDIAHRDNAREKAAAAAGSVSK